MYDDQYDQFEAAILKVKHAFKVEKDLERLLQVEGVIHCMVDMATTIIDLLVSMYNDTKGWIHYWIFELEFGNNYYDGCIVNDKGEKIKLKTIHDLFTLLETDWMD